jgi:hypothetical protein
MCRQGLLIGLGGRGGGRVQPQCMGKLLGGVAFDPRLPNSKKEREPCFAQHYIYIRTTYWWLCPPPLWAAYIEAVKDSLAPATSF